MKSKHLTLDQRKAIQDGIENRLSKTAIARLIGKDPSTVAKEITAQIMHQASQALLRQMPSVQRTVLLTS